MEKMKQPKQNERHKTSQSNTKPAKKAYIILRKDTDGEENGIFG
jgi:hypothetical protein